MRFFAVACCLGLLLLSACSPGKSAAAGNAGGAAANDEINETMGRGEVIGIKVVRGTLQHSKGRMGELGGMIIPADLLTEAGAGRWKPEYEAMVGKQVEAQGEHYRYTCSPIEQCLEGGVINYLQSIVYIKLVE